MKSEKVLWVPWLFEGPMISTVVSLKAKVANPFNIFPTLPKDGLTILMQFSTALLFCGMCRSKINIR